MPSTHDEIQAKSTELDSLLTEAHIHIRAFVKSTAQAIREQALPIAKAIGKSQPAPSTRLGNDGLKALAAEVAQYAATAESISEKCINNQKTAWYSLTRKDKGRHQHHPKVSLHVSGSPVGAELVSNQVLDCLVPLGDILHRKGFSTTYENYFDAPHAVVWQLFKWSEDMVKTLKRYAEADKKIHAVLQEVDALNKKKLQDEAAKLWDSV